MLGGGPALGLGFVSLFRPDCASTPSDNIAANTRARERAIKRNERALLGLDSDFTALPAMLLIVFVFLEAKRSTLSGPVRLETYADHVFFESDGDLLHQAAAAAQK